VRGTLEERFWAKVDKRGPDECWPWLGAKNQRGCGQIRADGKLAVAPKIAWELAHGPMQRGMSALHRCDNPPCCNAAHIFPGTQSDNINDMVAKRRHGKTKLTDDDVIDIRIVRALGGTYNSIAIAYGISRVQASNVATGKQWAHMSEGLVS
jgi:hypothetical protein